MSFTQSADISTPINLDTSVDSHSSIRIHSWLATVSESNPLHHNSDQRYSNIHSLSLDTTRRRVAAVFKIYEDEDVDDSDDFEHLQKIAPRPKRRKSFEEVPVNTMQQEHDLNTLRKPRKSSHTSSKSGIPTVRTRASSRRDGEDRTAHQQQEEDGADKNTVEEEVNEVGDCDATPRSNKSWREPAQYSLFSPPPPIPAKPQPSSPTRSTRSTSTRTSTHSSSSSRSRSPTKKIVDFKLSNLPITRVNFGSPGFRTPELARPLYNDIQIIYEHGDGVVPSYFSKRVDFEELSIRQHQTSEYIQGDGSWTPDQFYDQVEWVNEAARYCANRDVSEAEWNSEVHSRLLKLSLRGRWQSKGIWYSDVTSARIHDRSLVPTVDNIPMKTKMVDYCLTLENFEDQVQEKLKTVGIDTINHTNASYLRYSPIAVSIETKRAGDDEEAANVQLGLWVCAHFTNLRRLIPEGTAIPPLVLVLVQGHDWKMMIADLPENKGILLFRYQMLGQTDRVLGICKLVASIRRIARYMSEVYAPWFEKYVLRRA